jgi:hypothetical protein
MTASCLSTPFASSAPFVQRADIRASVPAKIRRVPLTLALVSGLVLAAVLLAPEQPMAQAEICQRYNGAAACRVW